MHHHVRDADRGQRVQALVVREPPEMAVQLLVQRWPEPAVPVNGRAPVADGVQHELGLPPLERAGVARIRQRDLRHDRGPRQTGEPAIRGRRIDGVRHGRHGERGELRREPDARDAGGHPRARDPHPAGERLEAESRQHREAQHAENRETRRHAHEAQAGPVVHQGPDTQRRPQGQPHAHQRQQAVEHLRTLPPPIPPARDASRHGSGSGRQAHPRHQRDGRQQDRQVTGEQQRARGLEQRHRREPRHDPLVQV